jgi:chromate transporter
MTNTLEKNKLKLLIEIYYTFLKLGTFGFGGGYSLIPLIEREIVENKKWIDKEHLIDTFAVAECLPGAIALNASGFVGYSIAKVPGAIAAMLGNITSPIAIVLTLSIMFAKFSSYPVVQSAFNGIRPAIIGLIAYSGYKIGKTSLKDATCFVIAICAFVGVLFLHLHPILLILSGAAAGIILSNLKERMNSRKAIEAAENKEVM